MVATIRQARALRRRESLTERALWALLRDRRLEGVKFRRQVPIGPYIVDFVCLRHRLVVEADGPFHDEAQDARRDAWFGLQAFRVLRFSNVEVAGDRWAILSRILEAVSATPHPSAFG